MLDELTTISFREPFPDLVQNMDLVLDIFESRFVGQVLEKVANLYFRRGHDAAILAATFSDEALST